MRDNRIATMEYDWRNRLVKTITTDGPNRFYQQPTLDNQGRAIYNRTFRVESGGDVLIAQSKSFYDDRGRSYRSQTYGVDDAGNLGQTLVSQQWYDANGQVIKSTSLGSQAFSKTTYDALGRSTAQYTAYFDGTGLDDPTSVVSNIVLTESRPTYNDASQVISSTSKDRLHDAAGSGPLAGPVGSGPKSRDSYSATWYDGIGRAIASANYGTNDNDGTPIRPSVAPTSSDTILVSQTKFDQVGQAFETVDPMGRIQQTQFDDAGRTTKTIANFGGTDMQTVRTKYNTSGQLWKQIAENDETGDQITTYTYGVSLADSNLASKELQRSLTHPDGGVVTYTYDRTGQQTSMTDPNGSTHQYRYDKAGRRTKDIVSSAGTGVDGVVRRIEHSFDNRQRLQQITSFTSPSGNTVQSDVKYQYNPFGQITAEYQQHGAEVDTATSPVVEYGYEDGSANTIRQNYLTYPNGRNLTYQYGASGSQTDVLDRIASISDGSTTLVTYDYQGSGQMVTQTYNQPGIEKDYVLDRFGRMEELNWAKGQTDLVDFRYGYDRNSNRLFERNQKSNTHSHLLGYDQLNRMTSFQAGSLNSGNTAISSPAIDQSFTLDETGNFTGFNESGSSVSTLNQTRVHDTVNEITNISQSSGTAWATPNHDANGNMTVIPNVVDSVPESSFTATWDAWNRLIKLADDGDTVASYQYDGNNRRIVVQKFAAGSAIEVRHVYYSSASQSLEERVNTATTADTQFVWNLGYMDDLILRDRDTSGNGSLNERI